MYSTCQETSFFNRPIIHGTLRLFVPALLLLLILLSIHYHSQLEQHSTSVMEKEAEQLQATKLNLLKDLNGAVNDLIILSESLTFREFNTDHQDHALRHLQQQFLTLSTHRGIYDQVRYLDADGMEVVRINFNRGAPSIVPAGQLQNKGKRYYFDDSFKLEPKQIFISPLDLNIEKGQVEQPLKPMIRLGMPVLDHRGEKIGVVLLNYLAQQLIDSVDQLSHNHSSDAMLLNADGYWLSHPDPEQRWGFMFKQPEKSMGRQFPDAWLQIGTKSRGQFHNPQGLFTFDTIYPLGEEMFSSSGAADAYARSKHPIFSNSYFWKIVTRVHPWKLQQQQNHLLLFTVITGTVLSLLLLLISWWRAFTQHRHQITTQALEESNQRHTSTLDSALDAIITTDDEGRVVEFNPSARRLFEFDQEEVIGKDVASLIIPQEYRDAHHQGLYRASHNDQYRSNRSRIETVAQTIEGRRFPIEITVVQMSHNHHHFYTAFLRDISDRKAFEESMQSAKRMLEMRVHERTEELVKINQDLQDQIIERVRTEERLKIAQDALKKSNQKLAEHAAKDSLTGIANRRSFDNHLYEEWRRCQRNQKPIALIMFDVDFFKRYNDNYGHLAGDECLRAIGERLRIGAYSQRPGDLVARYGGEEFVVVLSETDEAGATRVGEAIRKEIASLGIVHERREDAHDPIITVSLGIASMTPHPERNPEDLVAAADEALYAAKSGGRNQLVAYSKVTTH